MKRVLVYLTMPQTEEELNSLKEKINARCDNRDYELYPVVIGQAEWMKRLAPWEMPEENGSGNTRGYRPAEGSLGKEGQETEKKKPSDAAQKLLHEIITTELPKIYEKYNLTKETAEFILAGYSMAGLFCLWSMYETDVFSAAVCCSGSLWYPQFKEFVFATSPKRNCRIYLSLGKKEEKAGNPLMRTVGDATREIYAHLQQEPLVERVTLEWNEGNHFRDVEERVAKGIAWALSEERGS